MEEKQMSITEALRFARHDFMNQLQLIRMNLELGRVEDAKTVIDAYASRMNQLAEVVKLGLPKLVEWIQTAPWKYPGLNPDFTCQGQKVDSRYDSSAVTCLDNLFKKLNEALNPYHELECHVTITVVNEMLTMGIIAIGEIENLDTVGITEDQELFRITAEQHSPGEWKFCVTAI